MPSFRISFIKFQKDITDLVRPFLKRKKQRGSLTKRQQKGLDWSSREVADTERAERAKS